ncbi:HPr family phosphocarrier protein [Olsenella profusa]|uniref:HPr family phosphocarrier protein n=1 Tax=Olsenella profusa TaxID=138595 RepID=A0ABS2F3K4_9ACTN|nr:HPr family phosphocarrier protein [Olsenella profusa]MBM6775128.1 HPr family phosphocarrier protein [Olsenella profusa]
MLELPCDITDPLGLHVQLAVLLAGEAARWRSRVTLTHAGRTVDARQTFDLMMLGVRPGEHVVVRVDGPDEATAGEAIRKLLATF